jgi:serine/threonine protein phosphatase 1
MTGNWKAVLRMEKNKIGRDFVCGDIHGCFDDLEAGLAEKKFDKEKDRLFCVGDLIDRGPQSELATFYMNRSWFFTVMGNHEQMFLMGNYMDFPGRKKYLEGHIMNGGGWAYKMEPGKVGAMLEAIDDLPLIIRVGNVIVTHAAIPMVKNLEIIEKNPADYIETVLWYRGKYPPLLIPEIDVVYVGHTITPIPYVDGKVTNIDTGAFLKYRGKEGKLTIKKIGEGK